MPMTKSDQRARTVHAAPCAYCRRRRRSMHATGPIAICVECHRYQFGAVLAALDAYSEQRSLP